MSNIKQLSTKMSSLIFCVALLGCDSIGSEVMVFGTDTKVAIDVSGDPTGQPSLTIGYKRREAVWLPLSVRDGPVAPTHLCDASSKPFNCTSIAPGTAGSHVCQTAASEGNARSGNIGLICVEAGKVGRALYHGTDGANNNGSRDSYSVVASFGLKSDTDGSAQIAQYFATGLAARSLVQQGGAALVSSAAVSPETEAAIRRLEDETRTGIDEIVRFVYKDGSFNKSNLDKLADSSTLQSPNKDRLKTQLDGLSEQDFRTKLRSEFKVHIPTLAQTAGTLS